METNERLIFTIEDQNGIEQECEALLTFESGTNGKSYIVYTNHEKDEDGDTKVFAGTYDPSLNSQTIKPIETDLEWKIIETVLDHALQNVGCENLSDMEEDINSLLDALDMDFPEDDESTREYVYSNSGTTH